MPLHWRANHSFRTISTFFTPCSYVFRLALTIAHPGNRRPVCRTSPPDPALRVPCCPLYPIPYGITVVNRNISDLFCRRSSARPCIYNHRRSCPIETVADKLICISLSTRRSFATTRICIIRSRLDVRLSSQLQSNSSDKPTWNDAFDGSQLASCDQGSFPDIPTVCPPDQSLRQRIITQKKARDIHPLGRVIIIFISPSTPLTPRTPFIHISHLEVLQKSPFVSETSHLGHLTDGSIVLQLRSHG